MATFLLVRHGEPDYDAIAGLGFFGFGRALAPLTARGVDQAERAALDPRLRSADVLLSSPYTRALQTAAAISRKTGLPITVEPELHEWVVDRTNRIASTADATVLFNEFHRCRGVPPEGQDVRWESLAELRARIRRVADKYAGAGHVIIVGHGMAFRTLTRLEKLSFAEIVECCYEKGWPDCEFLFRE